MGISGFPGLHSGLGPVPGAGRGLPRVLCRGRGRARRLHGGRAAARSTAGTTWPGCSSAARRERPKGSATAWTWWCATTSSRRPSRGGDDRPGGAAGRRAGRCDAGERRRGHGAAWRLRARKTWRTLEPLHGMIYFVPEAAEAYAALGVTGRAGYFASRAAPMGAVAAEVVVSTFFNFNPDLVRRRAPRSMASRRRPAALVAARLDAVDAAWRRLLGDAGAGRPAEMRRAADLARACSRGGGGGGRRDAPGGGARRRSPGQTSHICMLWHAQSILREFRGDGHVAQLVVHGLSGLEALVTHAAAGDVPARRAAPDSGLVRDAWEQRGACAARAGLARAGVTDSGSPSGAPPSGRRSRKGPTRWRPRPTRCWATTGARSCAPWPGPGARFSSVHSCRPARELRMARAVRRGWA